MLGKNRRLPAAAASARGTAGNRAMLSAMQYKQVKHPLHTVYGGAHLFGEGTIEKVNRLALNAFQAFAPDPASLARCFAGMGSSPQVWKEVHARLLSRLTAGSVQDYRIDFEDGYGIRSGEEEDTHAVAAARAFAANPPSCLAGIRVRPLNGGTRLRALRTLQLFFSELLQAYTPGPSAPVIVTLPKVEHKNEVETLARRLRALENKFGLQDGSLLMEVMAEVPANFQNGGYPAELPALIRACGGRCVAAHFGAYDYLSALGVPAYSQSLAHPWCNFARYRLLQAAVQENIRAADGATTVLPVPPHRAEPGKKLSGRQVRENLSSVWDAWRAHAVNVQAALAQGIYQGWDLHPAQIVARYAAVYAFFLNALPGEVNRLRGFIQARARANRSGTSFDDAATARGAVNFFAMGYACGVFGSAEAAMAGVPEEILRSGNFDLASRAR